MFLDGLADRAEDDSFLCQLLLEGCLYRHGVHDGINCRAAQCEPLLQRNPQLVEGLCQLRIHLLVLGFLCQGVGIIGDVLQVQLGQMQMSPCRDGQRLPVVESLQTKIEEPLRLPFLLRNEPDNLLVQSFRDDLCMYIGCKAELVLLLCDLLYKFIILVFIHL